MAINEPLGLPRKENTKPTRNNRRDLTPKAKEQLRIESSKNPPAYYSLIPPEEKLLTREEYLENLKGVSPETKEGLDQILASITNYCEQNNLLAQLHVVGGSIRKLKKGEKPKDIDLIFNLTNKTDKTSAIPTPGVKYEPLDQESIMGKDLDSAINDQKCKGSDQIIVERFLPLLRTLQELSSTSAYALAEEQSYTPAFDPSIDALWGSGRLSFQGKPSNKVIPLEFVNETDIDNQDRTDFVTILDI